MRRRKICRTSSRTSQNKQQKMEKKEDQEEQKEQGVEEELQPLRQEQYPLDFSIVLFISAI